MAEQTRKSKAERAASSGTKNKSSSSKSKTSKNSGQTTAKTTKTEKPELPVRLISSCVLLGLFFLFLFSALNQQGVFLSLIKKLVSGLIGKTGYVVSIPVLLYLFFIHAFSGERPIKMRTVCLCCFVVVCGAIAHMTNPALTNDGIVGKLYFGGISGTTGGLISGVLAILMNLCLGKILTFIVLFVAGLLLLLAGMQITIPSIIRAIKERPRADWEEEEQEERQEPASVVVNHFANKRIAYLERRRQAEEDFEEELAESSIDPDPELVIEPFENKRPTSRKAREILKQIDSDVEEPVAASNVGTSESIDSELLPLVTKKEKSAVQNMPILDPEDIDEGIAEIDPVPEAKAKKINKDKVTPEEA